MTQKIGLLLFLSVVTLQVFGQKKPAAILFDTYREIYSNTQVTNLSNLEEKVRLFAKELKNQSRVTKGVVIFYTSRGDKNANYCSKEKLTAEIRNDFVRDILIASKSISPRRLVSLDGYLREGTQLEFWWVPKGASMPEARSTAHVHCECSSIEVVGPKDAFNSKETLTFTANISGGMVDRSKYVWTVSAGKIVSGQGTPTIDVKIYKTKAKTITAMVNANGCCENCNDSSSFTTSLLPKLK